MTAQSERCQAPVSEVISKEPTLSLASVISLGSVKVVRVGSGSLSADTTSLSAPNSTRKFKSQPSPRHFYKMDFLALHQAGGSFLDNNNGPPSCSSSIAVCNHPSLQQAGRGTSSSRKLSESSTPLPRRPAVLKAQSHLVLVPKALPSPNLSLIFFRITRGYNVVFCCAHVSRALCILLFQKRTL